MGGCLAAGHRCLEHEKWAARLGGLGAGTGIGEEGVLVRAGKEK